MYTNALSLEYVYAIFMDDFSMECAHELGQILSFRWIQDMKFGSF